MVAKPPVGVIPTGRDIRFGGLCAVGCSGPAAGDRGERGWRLLDGLFKQPVEEQPDVVGAAAVEAEGELVEVEVELVRAEGALVGAELPALEQRGDAVRARHHDMRRLAAGSEAGRVVAKAGRLEAGVALPGIGVDDRAGGGGGADELGQRRLAGIADPGEANTPAGAARPQLDRDRDDRLAMRASARSLRVFLCIGGG
jgi:hypothetical protein